MEKKGRWHKFLKVINPSRSQRDQINDASFSPQEESSPSNEFLSSVLESLRTGEPLDISELLHSVKDQPPLGDTIITNYVCHRVLGEFANLHGIEQPLINLSILRGLPLIDTAEYPEDVIARSRIEAVFRQVCQILDVPFSDDFLNNVPIIYPLEGLASLANFSYETVLDLAQEKEAELEGKKAIAICQAGSSAYKRLSDEQFAKLENELRQRYPDLHFFILRDTELSDLNELAATFFVCEKVITTDTSWSWVAGNVRLLQQARNRDSAQVIVFHTISNEYWHVPGTDSVYGPATQLTDLHDERSPGLLLDFQYKNYASGRDVWDMDPDDDGQDVNITDNDFEYFMEEIGKVTVD